MQSIDHKASCGFTSCTAQGSLSHQLMALKCYRIGPPRCEAYLAPTGQRRSRRCWCNGARGQVGLYWRQFTMTGIGTILPGLRWTPRRLGRGSVRQGFAWRRASTARPRQASQLSTHAYRLLQGLGALQPMASSKNHCLRLCRQKKPVRQRCLLHPPRRAGQNRSPQRAHSDG